MMTESRLAQATLQEWIARESIPFSISSPATFIAAVDQVIKSAGDDLKLLGFGEALHGSVDLLTLRNRVIQRLTTAHGFSAIAIESSSTRGRTVNDYVVGRGAESYESIRDAGFSHGFGSLEANREIVKWMRRYNAEPSHPLKVHFYGFDSPTEMTGTESPRQFLDFALDYLASAGGPDAEAIRERMNALLGDDAAWENPAAMMDPTQSVGRTAEATELRLETEQLIVTLRVRRPELVASTDAARYREALHYARSARHLLTYHAGLAGTSKNRTADLLGLRDVMMADNLNYIVTLEQGRGKVMVFAHNSHLKRGQAQWQLGPDLLTWWPAGSQVAETLGSGYAVMGTAVGISEAHGIGNPEEGSLEARLRTSGGQARLIPTHLAQGLDESEIAALPTRSGSTTYSSYFPLTSQSLTDFDWLAVLDATS